MRVHYELHIAGVFVDGFFTSCIILKKKKESYGYACLTKEKQYYIENYPDIVVEKGTVDELIAMMIGGNEL